MSPRDVGIRHQGKAGSADLLFRSAVCPRGSGKKPRTWESRSALLAYLYLPTGPAVRDRRYSGRGSHAPPKKDTNSGEQTGGVVENAGLRFSDAQNKPVFGRNQS